MTLNGFNLEKESKDSDGNYISTKYETAYENGTSSQENDTTVYRVSKIGDAIKEVRVSDYIGWFTDYCVVCRSGGSTEGTFFLRGSNNNGKSAAGIFASGNRSGAGYDDSGFRTVLCP